MAPRGCVLQRGLWVLTWQRAERQRRRGQHAALLVSALVMFTRGDTPGPGHLLETPSRYCHVGLQMSTPEFGGHPQTKHLLEIKDAPQTPSEPRPPHCPSRAGAGPWSFWEMPSPGTMLKHRPGQPDAPSARVVLGAPGQTQPAHCATPELPEGPAGSRGMGGPPPPGLLPTPSGAVCEPGSLGRVTFSSQGTRRGGEADCWPLALKTVTGTNSL